MLYKVTSASNRNIPEAITPSSQKSFCASDETIKKSVCYQYVNPNLLFQWEGDIKKSNQISGNGIFRAYERSKDGNHKSKLVLSLEANKWKQGKPNGEVKLMQVFFYDSNRKDNIIKEVRKFAGKMENMMKEGYGEYTIEHFYSNQTKSVIEIHGTWYKDFLVQSRVFENGKEKDNVKFSHNVQIIPNYSNQTQPIQENSNLQTIEKRPPSRLILNPISTSNKGASSDIDKKQDSDDQVMTTSLLVPGNGRTKANQKSIR